MNEKSQAVFLSYASQDADAARRICEALRAAGVEVWFDQSELRGAQQKLRHPIAKSGTRFAIRQPTPIQFQRNSLSNSLWVPIQTQKIVSP